MRAILQGGEYIFSATKGRHKPLNNITLFFSSSLCKSLSPGEYHSMVTLV